MKRSKIKPPTRIAAEGAKLALDTDMLQPSECPPKEITEKLDKLIRSRRYKYVFHGHTHRQRDEKIGKTRVINPGALGGARYEPRTVCIVDLDKDDVRFIPVSNW